MIKESLVVIFCTLYNHLHQINDDNKFTVVLAKNYNEESYLQYIQLCIPTSMMKWEQAGTYTVIKENLVGILYTVHIIKQ